MSSGDTVSDRSDFLKLVSDFTKDILTTFPEEAETLDDNLRQVVIEEDTRQVSKEVCEIIWEKCYQVYPPRFFDILYQNAEIFDEKSDNDTEFLPGIDFSRLWALDISDKTRQTIWKYLQLVLLRVVSEINEGHSFGETAKLFEAIDEDALKTKLEQTVKDMEEVFGKLDSSQHDSTDTPDSSIPVFDSSGVNPDDLPNPEAIHNHLTGLLKGKLGRLAQEIAEETAQELGSEFGDLSEIKSADGAFKKLFKNPGKLLSLVKKVGGKLEDKIKSGEIKESELLQEAGEFMSQMNNMPGMGNLKNVLGQMGMPGLGKDVKINMGALNGMMRSAQTRDRLRAKLAKKKQEQEQLPTEMGLSCGNSNSKSTPIISKFSTGEQIQRSKRGQIITDTNEGSAVEETKKPKKKKNKNKKK